MDRNGSTDNTGGAVNAQATESSAKALLSRVLRAGCYLMGGALIGALAGYFCFAMLWIGWNGMAAADSISRGGGDPIDGWATGVVGLMLAAPVVLAGTVGGIVAGTRLAFSSAQIARENMLADKLRPMRAFIFSPANGWGQAGLTLGSIVGLGWLLRLTNPPEDVTAVMFLAQILLTLAAGLCSLVGLRRVPRARAVWAGILAMLNLCIVCSFLNGVA